MTARDIVLRAIESGIGISPKYLVSYCDASIPRWQYAAVCSVLVGEGKAEMRRMGNHFYVFKPGVEDELAELNKNNSPAYIRDAAMRTMARPL